LEPVVTGKPIELADLSGRIVTDDFEDVFAFDVDGSNFVRVADDPAGSEFDGAWSPDGKWVTYRDSTRGINNDDEIFIASADGSERRNLTDNPANDWGPDWSPDGSTIAFNSDRDGEPLAGYLVSPDGSNLRRIDTDVWFEYPSWSPDGRSLAFNAAIGSNFEIFVLELETGEVTQLTDSPGQDAWPAWSPDGSTIAFMSARDDCRFAPPTQECWQGTVDDEYHNIWTIRPDGTGLQRVTPEISQFVTWSPDSRYLLISGHALFIVRPDGTGRVEVRTPDIPRPLGGIPDWR
jgi:TolB protein